MFCPPGMDSISLSTKNEIKWMMILITKNFPTVRTAKQWNSLFRTVVAYCLVFKHNLKGHQLRRFPDRGVHSFQLRISNKCSFLVWKNEVGLLELDHFLIAVILLNSHHTKGQCVWLCFILGICELIHGNHDLILSILQTLWLIQKSRSKQAIA